MENYSLPLDDETGKILTLCLMTDVKNTKEIREKVVSGDIRCCIVKAAMVIDPLQIVVAANKAALRESRSQLTTRSIFTEILYAMSASTNISMSLAKFGILDNDKNIIIVVIHEDRERDIMEQVLRHVEGTKMPVFNIKEFADEKLVKKFYRIEDQELSVSTLRDSVVSRIAIEQSVKLW